MNKKFLSAILFGALMITSTGTFVSCKDYDDDINDLQEQIDDLKSSLTADVATLKADLAAAKSDLEGKLAAAKSDLESKIANKADKTAVTALENQIATINEKLKAIETLQGEIDALEEALKTKAGVTELNKVADDLKALKEEVYKLMDKTLTSLVFVPDAYLNGIEAVKVSSIEYKALKLNAVSADGKNAGDKADSLAMVQMTPTLVATYHMNPSTADVSGLKNENFKLLMDEKELLSRATAPTWEILKFEPKGGDLSVTAQLTGLAIAEGKKVTTMALEVTLEEGKTVTSDYAAVYNEKITGFVLDEEQKAGCNMLFGTAQEAIDADPIVKVAYNDTVNLADYVETHYKNASGACAALGEDKLSGFGFSYKYELVGYTDGTNETSQSAHAALKGSVLKPQLPQGGKAATWEDGVQNPATVGRMPLVRVTLIDNISEKNVAVGYVKVEITAIPGKNTNKVNAEYTFSNPFTLSCAAELDTMSVAWFQIEETILKGLNISKAEFKANYKFAADTLWNKVGLDATVVTDAAIKSAVKVVEGTDIIEGTTTEVLKMNVAANYAYEYFQKNTAITAIVRYAKENGKDALGNMTYDFVYVTLKWVPSPLNVNPTGIISNEDKIKQYWFADDNNEGGSGYNEIHVNVNVPGDGQAKLDDTNFKKNMLNTFVDNNITISGVEAVYADFQDSKLTKKLVFANTQSTTPLVGNDGKTYVIKGSGDGLFAYEIVNNEVSTVANRIATILNDSVIQYVSNPVSKALLNAEGRDELAKNVTATILVKEANQCGKSLKSLENNTFDVKFLRPINVAQDTMNSFKDGVDVGAEGSKVALKLKFTDWRNYDFTDAYFTHYGVTSIVAHTEKATTNVSGGSEYKALPAGMSLTYTPASTIKLADMGYLTYKNNNAEVGNFSIKVPVTITYVWGTIEMVVTFEVAKTV